MKRTLSFLAVLLLLGAATPYIRDYITVLGSTSSLPASAPAGSLVYVPDAGPVFFDGATWRSTSYANPLTSPSVVTNSVSAPQGTLVLSSDAGASSSDTMVKLGSSVANSNVVSDARLLSIRTGIGGSEVERLAVRTLSSTSVVLSSGNATFSFGDSQGAVLNYSGVGTLGIGSSAYFAGNTTVQLYGNGATSAGNVSTKIGTGIADGAVSATAKLMSVRTGIGGTESEYLFVQKDSVGVIGRIDQSGTNSSASPGDATINKPSGISAIASGATTVVITNSLIPNPATTKVRIMISWMGDHGAARSWVTQGTGSFTVTLSAAASADTTFAWEVDGLL